MPFILLQALGTRGLRSAIGEVYGCLGFLHVLGWGVCGSLNAHWILTVAYLRCFIGTNDVSACTYN